MVAPAWETAARQAGNDSASERWKGPPGKAVSRSAMCRGAKFCTGAILAWLRSPMRKVTPPGLLTLPQRSW
eukprot:6611446-Heterocapsa_arctica.AAC.1